MKSNQKKTLTFGDLIAGVYSTCTRREANALLSLAVNRGVVVFQGPQRFVIASR